MTITPHHDPFRTHGKVGYPGIRAASEACRSPALSAAALLPSASITLAKFFSGPNRLICTNPLIRSHDRDSARPCSEDRPAASVAQPRWRSCPLPAEAEVTESTFAATRTLPRLACKVADLGASLIVSAANNVCRRRHSRRCTIPCGVNDAVKPAFT
jgi:hypothetical protein